MVSSESAQAGDEAMSNTALVRVMTEDWMAAKQRMAKRVAMTRDSSSLDSRPPFWTAWSMAH